LGIGDWGLGIGPIPNPQSPIPISHTEKNYTLENFKKLKNKIYKKIILKMLFI
jgi:hypothetical protein